eukprot:scaffold231830_cov19-Tisochrysis_lutea.AAC.1
MVSHSRSWSRAGCSSRKASHPCSQDAALLAAAPKPGAQGVGWGDCDEQDGERDAQPDSSHPNRRPQAPEFFSRPQRRVSLESTAGEGG